MLSKFLLDTTNSYGKIHLNKLQGLYFCKINSKKIKSFDHKFSTKISKHVTTETQSLGQKAKEATKSTYYAAIVCAGVGALGFLMYAVFGELLSSFSPQKVYSAAVDKVALDPRVLDLFGGNIKCFGESSRRGRRQHINHIFYEVDGVKGMRINFYLKGQYRSGTAYLDSRATPNGWDFRYLFVQSDSYPHQVIILEDKRSDIDRLNSIHSDDHFSTAQST